MTNDKDKKRHAAHSEPELDISSLIDVSFLLLIFFLVTSTLIKTENELGLTLPSPREGGDPEVALAISIAGDGSVTIGGQELAGPSDGSEPGQIDDVRTELVEHKKRADLLGSNALISLSASGESSSQRFIDVINALAYAGIDHIAMTDDLAAN